MKYISIRIKSNSFDEAAYIRAFETSHIKGVILIHSSQTKIYIDDIDAPADHFIINHYNNQYRQLYPDNNFCPDVKLNATISYNNTMNWNNNQEIFEKLLDPTQYPNNYKNLFSTIVPLLGRTQQNKTIDASNLYSKYATFLQLKAMQASIECSLRWAKHARESGRYSAQHNSYTTRQGHYDCNFDKIKKEIDELLKSPENYNRFITEHQATLNNSKILFDNQIQYIENYYPKQNSNSNTAGAVKGSFATIAAILLVFALMVPTVAQSVLLLYLSIALPLPGLILVASMIYFLGVTSPQHHQAVNQIDRNSRMIINSSIVTSLNSFSLFANAERTVPVAEIMPEQTRRDQYIPIPTTIATRLG